MIKALDETNIMRGIASHKVLNFSTKSTIIQPEVSTNLNNRDSAIEAPSPNDIWSIRARNKPLIGCCEQTIKIPGYRTPPSKFCLSKI